MLFRTFLVAATVAAIPVASQTMAAANDYAFEPVKSELQKGNDMTIAVRLVQKSTNKPISDAVIVRTRIDMAPDGMPTMESPLAAAPSGEPGVYSFTASLPMAGHWLLSIAAKVRGNPKLLSARSLTQ